MRIRLKPQYLEELILDMRILLKENTVDLSIIDIQAEVLAFSLKKFDEFLSQNEGVGDDEKNAMRDQIFREASSAMQDMCPIYTESDNRNAITDARQWYDDASKSFVGAIFGRQHCRGYVFFKEYFDRLHGGKPVKVTDLLGYLIRG